LLDVESSSRSFATKEIMPRILIAIATASVIATPVYASQSGENFSKGQVFLQGGTQQQTGKVRNAEADPETLIDRLAANNCPLPGISDTGTYGGFLLEDSSPDATVLIDQHRRLQIPTPCQNTNVRNIVHLGAAALPALIRHLGDKRPTKLVVGQNLSGEPETFGGLFFAEEYDARQQSWPPIRCGADTFCEKGRPFEKPYAVKIGDVCFVLIGQIVNRRLSAVRYQPTAIVMVNSPIESPLLADRVRADWSGIDKEGLKNSLLADLHATQLKGSPDAKTEVAALAFVHFGALRRLRYYYSDTYASLTDADLELRKTFENDERSRYQR
jgi:hypothetical protein